MTSAGSRSRAAWLSRLDARVALVLGVLMLGGLIAVFVVTTGIVSSQSRDRAAVELEVARSSFHNVMDERVRSAMSAAELVTQLPVFRAHLTDARLAEDRENLDAMANGYREQMNAQFVIVARPGGDWAAHPGWDALPPAATTPLQQAVEAALSGTSGGAIVAHEQALYLTVSVPARFADEILGSLTLGYQLTDDLATQLARLAQCEVIIIASDRVVASSLGDRATADAGTLVSMAMAPAATVLSDPKQIGDRKWLVGTSALAGTGIASDEGRLVLLSDWQPTQAFIDRLRGRFAATGLVVLALSLVGGALFSRRISRPLRDIATAASEIAAGNLQLQLPERGTVESVTVARAFNGMGVSLRAARDQLVHDATHDPLTRLPNRALLMERLERAMIRRQRHPHYCFAVLFIDLDRFKHVNDSLGHSAGDRMLVLFAERLAGAVRREDAIARAVTPVASDEAETSTLARFGGDEFVVLLDDVRDPIDAVRVAERIRQLSTEPLRVNAEDLFATPSIGVAVCTAAHHSAEELVRDADMAMYRAKHGGGNNYALADSAMHVDAVNRLQLETELRRGLERQEFRVRYQPIVSLTDGRVVGFEALVRWQHPRRGLLSPADFLAVADEVGVGAQIDELVLREACRQGREWMDANASADAPTLSVNISPRCFAQEMFVQQVALVLSETGFAPNKLRLEITEGTAIKDPERACEVLTELRALGVRVSIDDFGTGYSSLSYLQMLPVDVLKIDRSFVSSTDRSEIIQLIVGLAKTLGLDVVAEGTETEVQVEHVAALGCGYAQGYFFAAPLDAADASRQIGEPFSLPSIGTGNAVAVSLA
jgi:predicted signal transduction protein with EAL and GGDEF domain